ncbi:MAG: hypothetical protein JWR34_5581 [Mycobacterium sp.]|nr:hypothetical protein [Mycobacterium sp.]
MGCRALGGRAGQGPVAVVAAPRSRRRPVRRRDAWHKVGRRRPARGAHPRQSQAAGQADRSLRRAGNGRNPRGGRHGRNDRRANRFRPGTSHILAVASRATSRRAGQCHGREARRHRIRHGRASWCPRDAPAEEGASAGGRWGRVAAGDAHPIGVDRCRLAVPSHADPGSTTTTGFSLAASTWATRTYW